MPGVIMIKRRLPIGQAIEELTFLLGTSEPEDFDNRVQFIPIT